MTTRLHLVYGSPSRTDTMTSRSIQTSRVVVALATAMAACGAEPEAESLLEPAPIARVCSGDYREPVTVGPVGEQALLEASGIVASRLNRRVLWLHNDSGDASRIYAIRDDGAALGRVNIPGVALRDLEDIAAGPCPFGDGDCLWLADTGNNLRNRTDQSLVVIPEPAIGLEPFGVMDASTVWQLPVDFPDYNIDSEALAIAPDGSVAYLIEKEDLMWPTLYAYRAPFQIGQRHTLEEVGTFAAPPSSVAGGQMVTGADLHPTGERLIVRVYAGVFEYHLINRSMNDLGLASMITVPLGTLYEPQGESVAYSASGRELWTISESGNGINPEPLHLYTCTATD